MTKTKYITYSWQSFGGCWDSGKEKNGKSNIPKRNSCFN